MDRPKLLEYLEKIDQNLKNRTILFIYGSAVLMLLDEINRISLDIDVAAPYSTGDFNDISSAANQAGLPINPPETYQHDHIEWISQLRLCLSKPNPETDLILWQGSKLTVKTVSPAKLAASKLIRYDQADQSDVRYICEQTKLRFGDIESAVGSLPSPFRTDAIVCENLENLKIDMQIWNSGK